MMKGPLVSVVICTYNRSDLLLGCLQSLVAKALELSMCEVIVVNNNSTDATQKIAEEFAESHCNFRVFVEAHQGLSHARNRGWKEARGEYVAYIDDDARACPDWLEAISDFIRRHPDVEAFGGPYAAFAQVPIPTWFPPGYGSWDLGCEERVISVGKEWLNGTNMVFKRTLLERVGGFNTRLGMSGDTVAYGEETRLLLELDRRGVAVYYVPQMKVEHLLASYKISLRWLLNSAFQNGRCARETFDRKRSLLSHLYGVGKAGGRALCRLVFSELMPLKRRVYFACRGVAAECGALVDRLSMKHRNKG